MSDFCRVPEQALSEAATNLCRWPDGNVPWTLQTLLPGMTEDEMVKLLQPYFSKWRRVRVWYVERAAEARVLVGARYIDGVNGVLADCYLPCGNVKSVKLQFDLGDDWKPEKLGQTAWHEFGHAIGISHSPNRGNIMYASLDMSVQECGPWDELEEKRRYPAVMPPPLPPTKVVLDFKGTAKSVAATLQGQQITVTVEGAVTDVSIAGTTLPPPIVPPTGGGIVGILEIFKFLGPVLELFRNPEFQRIIALIIEAFTKKQAAMAVRSAGPTPAEHVTLTDEDYEELAAAIKAAKP